MSVLRSTTTTTLLERLADMLSTLWALFLRDVAPGTDLRSRLAALRVTLVDHLWGLASVVLAPIVGYTAGPVERRCWARALRLDAPTYPIEMRHVDTAVVGDGVVLRATLWLPKGEPGPFPTVIIRNPYGGAEGGCEWGQGVLSERGYAVLLQDTRGRFGSDGDFIPVEHEREDGAATVSWVRRQPWCNGRVGVFGISYLGLTAWACVGASDPGDIQASVTVAAQSRIHSTVFRPGGAVCLELLTLWLTLVYKLLLIRSAREACETLLHMWNTAFFARAAAVEPLADLDLRLLGRRWDVLQKGLADTRPAGEFWRTRNVLCDVRGEAGKAVPPDGPPPPIHLVTGWHDFFCHELIRDYEDVVRSQRDARLTIDVIDHWGLASLRGMQLIFRCLLDWLDTHLMEAQPDSRANLPPLPGQRVDASTKRSPSKRRRPASPATEKRDAYPANECGAERRKGGANELGRAHRLVHAVLESPPGACLDRWLWGAGSAIARLAVGSRPPSGAHHLRPARESVPLLGGRGNGRAEELAEELVDESSLPVQLCMLLSSRWEGFPSWPPAHTRTRTYLSPRKQLVWSSAETRAHGLSTLSYRYDPSKPTPACGGPSFNPLNIGERSQRAIERRSDVLVFTSAPLAERLTIAGRVQLHVRVSASSASIDIVGRLCSVSSMCASVNVCEGLLRIDAPGDGSVGGEDGTDAMVDLGAVAADFAAGTRLRIHVCSAAHPRWMRNLCAPPKAPLAQQTCGDPAAVCLWAGDGESWLELPVIPSR